jgi:hypothetical protein
MSRLARLCTVTQLSFVGVFISEVIGRNVNGGSLSPVDAERRGLWVWGVIR